MTIEVDIYNRLPPKIYLDYMMEVNPNYEDPGKRSAISRCSPISMRASR